MTKPTPPRPSSPPPGRPPNMISCPGCGKMISREFIACGRDWRRVPGTLKAKLSGTVPGTIGRARVVVEMRLWLREHDEYAGA